MTSNPFPALSRALSDFDQVDETPTPERLSALHALHDARVMIIDDEPIMMDVVQAFLEDAGYSQFLTLNDSAHAMETIRKERPDVLLMDLIMPGKSGFDLLADIRKDPSLRYLPVIVLTGAGDPETKLEVLELGATDFLSKPVDPSELKLRLRNALAFKAYQDQLAYHDALTGLPNRQLFLERLAWTLRLAYRHQKQCALLQVGIDRFKQINDTIGHDMGDEVLKAVARRLSATLRETDTVSMLSTREDAISLSRLAGDEFMVLIAEISQASDAAGVARRLLEAMKAPLMLNGHELFVSISIGIVVYPSDGMQSTELLTNVDLAMAQSKLHGRDTYSFYSAEANQRSIERLRMETALRKVIEKGELQVYYQPKVDIASGNIMGGEALARWNHPELGPVSPSVFIPLAEETGLIQTLGELVLRRACEDAAKWQQLHAGLPIAVNVSSLQFRRGNIPEIIRSALRDSGLKPDNLIIELTESLLMEKAQSNIQMLADIKALGVGLSMDDFGTGYSSLAYLKRFPLDELKIDQTFVQGLPEDSGNAAIVSAVISMAHGLGLKVTAEGVEKPSQLSFLKMHGCDHFQGFLFSHPVASTDFATLLTQKVDSLSNQDQK